MRAPDCPIVITVNADKLENCLMSFTAYGESEFAEAAALRFERRAGASPLSVAFCKTFCWSPPPTMLGFVLPLFTFFRSGRPATVNVEVPRDKPRPSPVTRPFTR